MSRALNDLAPVFRPIAFELLARLTEQGIMVLIVDTLRTQAEQNENLRKGVSWTKDSKHLHGLAIDVCPLDIYSLHGPDKLAWDSGEPVWIRIGLTGEQLGLRWGGRFRAPAKPDMGHFEYVEPARSSTVRA